MNRMQMVVFGALAVAGMGTSAQSTAAEPTIEELLDATDDVNRGESSKSTVTMQVKTKRYERTMTMNAWSQGEQDSLIRIVAPAKDAGRPR